MVRSMLMGAVAGARAITPLAALAATRGGTRAPVLSAGSLLLAAGELVGDKQRDAPDRIVPAGIAGRLLSGAIAGAACARRDDRVAGALVGAAAAVVASHLTFRLRAAATRRWGQTASGLIEDGLAVASAVALARA
ncbi:DUF4126 domain-containing protein [Sphingomonas sp. 8AM]|uniref:DUF4126 domain-containing protein n=1 Tax=Sphingomonas sp. 8AM TaxID=2653170 RepID=UPI0012EEED37|nr:DUF4126 domain-containing protein [Sphingomonas sp. 8AM]VXC96941.1 conserved exported hypothetical protein [Sphingomonas sp. 8AM]